MGDRGNVKIVWTPESDGRLHEPTYFYAHWRGSDLPGIVAQAISRGESRWDDESYLARIIFSEMIKDRVDDLTGFGIAPYEMDPENPTVTVDMEAKTVAVDGMRYPFAVYADKRQGQAGRV